MTRLVEMEEATAFLGEDTARLPHLQQWIDGLSTFIRRYIDRPLETQDETESLDGSGEATIRLSYTPVVTVDTLTIDGDDVDLDEVLVYDHGDLYYAGGFPAGRQNVVVTYTAGHGENVPDDMKLAALLILEQASQTSLLQQATRGEYAYVFAPTKWPKDARDIIESYRRKL
jgi:hypothetical protein